MPHVRCTTGDDVTARFVLTAEADPEQGSVELTDMLAMLIRAGVEQPYEEPEDGIPFGTVEIDGELEVTVDGRTLTDEETATAVGAGFIHIILQAIGRHDG